MKEESETAISLRRNKDAFNAPGLEIKFTALPHGAFARYTSLQVSEGADLAHLKPPHVNPPQKVLSVLRSSFEIVPTFNEKMPQKEASVSLG